MRKGYQVCRLGWEYNDEYFYLPESDSVEPGIVYFSEKKAEEALEKLQIAAFKEHNPMDYVGGDGFTDVSSIPTDEEVIERLNTLLRAEVADDDIWAMREYTDLRKAKSELVKEVIKVFDLLKFYEIREVEVEND